MTNQDLEKQVKSKQRVADYGEVYTNEREVNAMLDLVKHETERIDSRFLEPACGNGNFLAEVLRRKLTVVSSRFAKSQVEWEQNAIIAISSIYGIDILEDNVKECRERLYQIFENTYVNLFKTKTKQECLRSVHFLFGLNIVFGDALDFTNPVTKEAIILPEWSSINGTMLKRRDYKFQLLVESSYQNLMFSDEEEPTAIDEPIKDYPLVHYLELGLIKEATSPQQH